jgi:ATP-dependent helicase/nuclease subunit B
MLIDYKTEQADKTKKRITQDGEDTQLAFYAALLPDTAVRLAYLNISEKGQAVLHEQHNASALRQQLLQGIAHDLHAIAQGSPLPALGQGARCGYCAARGLCRRDFWQEQTA